jgi:hypothetical protein
MLESRVERDLATQTKKLENLEKFIAIKDAPQKQAVISPGKSELSFDVSTKVHQDLSQLKSSNESLNFKLESLKYDLELLKEDIVRQRTSQRAYLDKIESIEKKLDSTAISRQDNPYGTQDINFMAHSSSRLNEINTSNNLTQKQPGRVDPEQSKPAMRPTNPFGRMESLQGGFMEDPDRMSIKGGDFEAGNISIIERAAIGISR